MLDIRLRLSSCLGSFGESLGSLKRCKVTSKYLGAYYNSHDILLFYPEEKYFIGCGRDGNVKKCIIENIKPG